MNKLANFVATAFRPKPFAKRNRIDVWHGADVLRVSARAWSGCDSYYVCAHSAASLYWINCLNARPVMVT